MRRLMKKIGLVGMALALLPISGQAREVIFEQASGELQVIEISESDSFQDVLEYASQAMGTEELTLMITPDSIHMKTSKKGEDWRNYNHPLSKNELADLRFIMNSMARNSLATLALQRSSLKKAGDHIDHVHPLQFLIAVFSDEELKADLHAVRDRSWVWKEFLSGITGSLEAESFEDNLEQEDVDDFCKTLNVDNSEVALYFKKQKWKDFVNYLIDTIPREGNPERYDM